MPVPEKFAMKYVQSNMQRVAAVRTKGKEYRGKEPWTAPFPGWPIPPQSKDRGTKPELNPTTYIPASK